MDITNCFQKTPLLPVKIRDLEIEKLARIIFINPEDLEDETFEMNWFDWLRGGSARYRMVLKDIHEAYYFFMKRDILKKKIKNIDVVDKIMRKQ